MESGNYRLAWLPSTQFPILENLVRLRCLVKKSAFWIGKESSEIGQTFKSKICLNSVSTTIEICTFFYIYIFLRKSKRQIEKGRYKHATEQRSKDRYHRELRGYCLSYTCIRTSLCKKKKILSQKQKRKYKSGTAASVPLIVFHFDSIFGSERIKHRVF